MTVQYVDLAAKSHFFRCLCTSASILNAKIIDACLFRDRFSLFNNHIELIISFNLRLYNFNSVFKFFISVFVLKISIFRLCMTILCYFSSFLMLLTSKTCSHIALCASKTSAMYFFKIIRVMLFLFCVLTIIATIRSIFAFFHALFIESRIFIVFKVQFSFLKLTMSLLSQYDISCDFDENFLMIRFHSSAFTFTFAFAFVSWAAFYAYVSFCVDFCEFCMTCNVCELCIFCKICEFSVICFALIFFLMFSAFCWINCRMRSAMKLICMQCWLWIYCLATVKSKDYQKFE